MATQVTLGSGVVDSASGLKLRTNGSTEAVDISTGQVATLAQNPILTSGTANGVAYLNGSKVVTSGSALVFDGTNLGLGVTPFAYSSETKAIDIGAYGVSIANTAGYQATYANNAYYNSGWKYKATGYAPAMYSQNSGSHAWFTAASGTAGNAISFTQAMTLDASGNLGVGSTSPNIAGVNKAITLNTTNGSAGAIYEIAVNGTNYAYLFANSTNTVLSSVQNLPLVFNTNNTERARIDSSGSLLVGTTSNSGYGGLITASAATNSFNLLSLRDTGTTYGSSQSYAVFQNSGGSNAGSIQHTASTTVNYNTSSDARLKTSLGIATDTSVIDNIVIHDFEWIEDGRIDRGVFAQEANEVKPSAVSVGKDDLNEEGNLINPWGVDYSKFVPDLIVHAQQLKKQVQEQQTLITSQSELITALTARIEALEA